MALPFEWWTLTQAIAALRGRLQNPSFWLDAELTLYIQDSLRLWNALTEQWKEDYVLNSPQSLWVNTGTLAGSPRLRTVTDSDLYTRMQYMLLEPPTGGGAWAGTTQFDLESMQFALSKRRNEVIQAATCNLTLESLPLTPGTRGATLPDTVLEAIRARFVPALSFGDPIWLSREDIGAFQYWEPGYNQTIETPNSWDVIAQTPLTIGLDNAVAVPGTLEVVTLKSGPEFAPPAATLLGIPDDWAHVPMFGALGDLLAGEPERTDNPRAAYCKQRYQQGLKLIRQANWLTDSSVAQGPTDVLSLSRADQYDPQWDNFEARDNGFSQTIVAGMDFIALPNTTSVNLTLVGNQPVPVDGGDYLQISRDVADLILDYAQHLCVFKCGGDSFQASSPLLDGFYRAAAETNKRIEKLGLNFKELGTVGREEQLDVPRQ